MQSGKQDSNRNYATSSFSRCYIPEFDAKEIHGRSFFGEIPSIKVPSIKIPGIKFQVRDFLISWVYGTWTLGIGIWILGLGIWILGLGS